MQIRLTYQDDRSEIVKVIPLARRQYEAETGKPLLDRVREGYGDWREELVWRTLCIRNGESRSLEDWLRTVDTIQSVEEDAEESTADPADTVEADTPVDVEV